MDLLPPFWLSSLSPLIGSVPLLHFLNGWNNIMRDARSSDNQVAKKKQSGRLALSAAKVFFSSWA